MAKSPDVLIIGGGVIGLTTAYFLARDGVHVTIVDKGDFGQESSWAGAGIIPPVSDHDPTSPIDLLRAKSVAMFPDLSTELREGTGIDNGYLRCGGLEFIGHGGAEEEWHGAAELRPLSQPEIAKLEPALAPGLGAAFPLPDMAQVRNPRHVRALVAACEALGATLKPRCAVQMFLTDCGLVRAVNTESGTLSADRFLVTSGAWSANLLAPLGIRLGIKPIRGQIALLTTPTPLFRRILLWGSRYLVPRGDGKVLVGSTEEDVGFDKRTTKEAIEELLALAYRLVPGLRGAALERCWAGLRPGNVDGLPFLGRMPAFENLYIAAGHYRAGILLSPGTGLVMKQLLMDQTPSVDLRSFRVERTQTGVSA